MSFEELEDEVRNYEHPNGCTNVFCFPECSGDRTKCPVYTHGQGLFPMIRRQGCFPGQSICSLKQREPVDLENLYLSNHVTEE